MATIKEVNIIQFWPIERKYFEQIKEAMSKQINLIAYDPEKKTRVFHDACKTGLAYMIQQKDESAT